MKITKEDIIKENYTFSASFLSVIRYLEKELKDFVGNDYIELGDIIRLNREDNEEEGNIVLSLGYNGYLNIYRAKKKKKSNGFKSVIEIKDKRFSYSFLIWYFSQDVVKNYIKIFSKSNTLSRIRIKDFLEVLIPIPKENLKLEEKQRMVIEEYYLEYNASFREGNIISAIALAGGIIETILFSLLINNGVSKSLLERKMIGQLIEFVTIMKIFDNNFITKNGKKENILDVFKKVQKARNKIHSGVLQRNLEQSKEEIKEGLVSFDKIILYYGL